MIRFHALLLAGFLGGCASLQPCGNDAAGQFCDDCGPESDGICCAGVCCEGDCTDGVCSADSFTTEDRSDGGV
jgi:hypothetical protein